MPSFSATERPPRRASPTANAAQIAALFAADGPLSGAVGPGYEVRQGQFRLAMAVWDAFVRGRIALIDAGTATGKTRGYLVPAMRFAVETGEPVIVSTHAKALQNQLLGELRFLSERALAISPAPWSYAVLKGRGAYPCLYKLAQLVAEVGPTTPATCRLALNMLLVWVTAGNVDGESLALGWLNERDASGEAAATTASALCDEGCGEPVLRRNQQGHHPPGRAAGQGQGSAT